MATIVLEGRIDPKDLASIVGHYLDCGVTFSSKSEALRFIVHDFALTLRQVGARKYDNDQEALALLISAGLLGKEAQTKSIADALGAVKPHVTLPEEPAELDPSEVKNILSQLLDKPEKM